MADTAPPMPPPESGPPAGWLVARAGLRLLLVPSSPPPPAEVLHAPLTSGLHEVLCWTAPDERWITLLTARHLETWMVELPAAWDAARGNLDRLLAAAGLDVERLRGLPLGILRTDSVFKAALLRAPALRARVEAQLGWPLRAVAPCRDFVYLFRDRDDSMLESLAAAVSHEHAGSPQPLTLEVLRIGDDGVEAIGEYR